MAMPALLQAQGITSRAYGFLDVTSSALVYGLGGVNITTVDDNLAATDQNPALLDPLLDNTVALGYMRYLGSSNFASLRYARAINGHGTWSAGVKYFGYGSMEGYDEAGVATGSFSPRDLAVCVAASYDIYGLWRAGAEVKFLSSSYEQYSATALAVDLGVNYYDADRDLSFSIVAANMGGQIKKFTDRAVKLPIDLRVGWSKTLGNFPVRWSVTAYDLTHWHRPYYIVDENDAVKDGTLKDSFGSNLFRHLVFGAQLVSSDKFYLALGYNYRSRSDMSTYSRSFISGFSLGAGLRAERFTVDVALAQPHSGATTLMLNLSLNFNDLMH